MNSIFSRRGYGSSSSGSETPSEYVVTLQSGFDSSNRYVTINGVKYSTAGTTVTITPNTEVTVTIDVASSFQDFFIQVDGAWVSFMKPTYTFTPCSNIKISYFAYQNIEASCFIYTE